MFTSVTFRHWSKVISSAATQRGNPAKQQRIFKGPRVSLAVLMAFWTSVSLVTSHARVIMFAFGKASRRASMCAAPFARPVCRSRRASPFSPCSSKALAAASARTPAPPVTDETGQDMQTRQPRVFVTSYPRHFLTRQIVDGRSLQEDW